MRDCKGGLRAVPIVKQDATDATRKYAWIPLIVIAAVVIVGVAVTSRKHR
jgi:hypothetical protein